MILALGPTKGQHPSMQVIPSVSLSKYLVEFKFEGVYVGGINLTGKPRAKPSKSANLQAHNATLKFLPKPKQGNGRYELKIGSHLVTGEWNVFDGCWVNLWVDKIGKGQIHVPAALTFRAPRFVDDSWVATDIVSSEEFPLLGRLVMANAVDRKYWKQKDGGYLSPSRTEILLEPDPR